MELLDFFLLAFLDILIAIHALVAAAIPARVVVDGITDVVALDGMGLVILVIRLPASAWSPDNTRKPVGADLIEVANLAKNHIVAKTSNEGGIVIAV